MEKIVSHTFMIKARFFAWIRTEIMIGVQASSDQQMSYIGTIRAFPGNQNMFLKNGRYFSTGWMNGCEYGKDCVIDGELSFYTVKRIKPSGLYGGELEFALFRGEADPPRGTVVFSFPANGETYSIVVP